MKACITNALANIYPVEKSVLSRRKEVKCRDSEEDTSRGVTLVICKISIFIFISLT